MKRQTKLIIGLALSVISLCFSILFITDAIPTSPKKPKYIFYFIGDGMSFTHILGTEYYNTAKSRASEIERLNFSEFDVRNFVTNHSASHLVTDSAAAGTALATGCKTKNSYIGVDEEGKPLRTITDVASELGYKVGLVTNVGINHATPSSFYAHTTDRFHFAKLVDDYIASDVAFIAGATVIDKMTMKLKKVYEPTSTAQLAEHIRGAGIELTTDIELAANAKDRRVALVANDKKNKHMAYVIDRKAGEQHTLLAYTRAAIEHLTNNSDNGFFLMVEGGKIDYAAHSQDSATSFCEINEFAKTIDLALAFAEQHPDETLIVVTTDHDTGGLSLGYDRYRINMDLLLHQTISIKELTKQLQRMRAEGNRNWNDYKQALSDGLGLWSQIPVSKEEERLLRGDFDNIFLKRGEVIKGLYESNEVLVRDAIRIIQKQALINWAGYQHTGIYTPLYAKGVGEKMFLDCRDQTDIPKTIANLMGRELKTNF